MVTTVRMEKMELFFRNTITQQSISSINSFQILATLVML